MSEQQQNEKKIDIWSWWHDAGHMALVVGVGNSGNVWRLVVAEGGNDSNFPVRGYTKPVFNRVATVLQEAGAINQDGKLVSSWDKAQRIEFALDYPTGDKDADGNDILMTSPVALFIAPPAKPTASVRPGLCGVMGGWGPITA